MRNITILIILFFTILLISSCDVFNLHNGQKVVILSIGLDYKDSNVNDLEGTINDAKEVGMALKTLYDDRKIDSELIYMLQEGENSDISSSYYPSASNVLAQIRGLDLDADDLFVFYYAGHGQTGTDGKMFLACGREKVISNSTTIIRNYTELSMKDVQDYLSVLPCRSVVILDSCHSGMMDTLSEHSPNSVIDSITSIFGNSWFDLGKISVITAAAAREVAGDKSKILFENGKYEYHGYFSIYLLASLGWSHSDTKETEYLNKDNQIIEVFGYSSGIRGSLTLEKLYKEICAAKLNQNPKFFGTYESIVLIPSN